MVGSSTTVWIFGYGSNMDAEHLEKLKGVKVEKTRVCILPGYKLRFNLPSPFMKAEPAYANIEKTGEDKDEVHGVAFCISEEDAKRIDDIESSYQRQPASLRDYDGNWLDGFAYVSRPDIRLLNCDGRPTARYLSLLVRGAKEAGLQGDYVNRLAATPVHSSSPEDVELRQRLLKQPIDSLPAISSAEMGERTVSVFGFVFNLEPSVYDLIIPRGCEASKALLHYYHGIHLTNQQLPPHPTIDWLEKCDPDGLEFVMTWLDAFLETSGECIGRLSDYEALADGSYSLPSDAVYPNSVLPTCNRC